MSEGRIETVSILIAALGGEGGGTLANWVAQAIRRAGYLCQSTSIPGVAQRTGATTYYIEYCPIPLSELGDRRVVFALTPVPGRVDVFIGSELIEAARAVQNGYVSADRTTLIASAHRTYATIEKMAMADGRFDAARALKAVHDLPRRAIVFDMERATEQAGTVISAVLLGALAGSGALGIDPRHFEEAIKAGQKGVEGSLRGYRLGLEQAQAGLTEPEPAAVAAAAPAAPIALDTFPVETRFVIESGYRRTLDFQDRNHAEAFLAAAREFCELDRRCGGADRGWRLTIEAARYLALRMTYEDVIRVADLKTRPERFATVRTETRAAAHEPVQITEFLKPGPEELCALLPPRLAERFLAALRKRGLEQRFHLGLHLRSSTISGYLLLRLLGRMRLLRRRSWRFAQEAAITRRWRDAVSAAAELDYEFALEVAECADLIKGYGSTYRRGLRNFELIFAQLVEPALRAGAADTAALREARCAALADPEGEALECALSGHGDAQATKHERPVLIDKKEVAGGLS